MGTQPLDKDWFVQKLERNNKSIRGLAKYVGIDPSAASRMLNGQRQMRLDEADKIARFIGVTTEEVLQHAGVSSDRIATRTMKLGAAINSNGRVNRLPEAQDIPSSVIARAQASIPSGPHGDLIAAQVRAPKGALSIWDDAVVLYENSQIVEPSAVGVLSIVRLRDGVEMMGKLKDRRKTGEATVEMADGEVKEVEITAAMPVLAVIP